MYTKLAAVLMLLALPAAYAQAHTQTQTQTQTPRGVVDHLFDAMRAGDGAALSAIVVPEARLDRLMPDGSLKQGTFVRWINWVDQQSAGDADEQIFGVKTLQMSDELATVWAPFTIKYKGEMVGCGVNQFTLTKTKDGWRVVYGIDMPHEGDCEAYRAGFEK